MDHAVPQHRCIFPFMGGAEQTHICSLFVTCEVQRPFVYLAFFNPLVINS